MRQRNDNWKGQDQKGMKKNIPSFTNATASVPAWNLVRDVHD